MLKVMVSSPAELLAAWMASRRDIWPSAPLFAFRASSDVTVPSLTSETVVTISVLATSVTVTVIACVSVGLTPLPSLTSTVRL